MFGNMGVARIGAPSVRFQCACMCKPHAYVKYGVLVVLDRVFSRSKWTVFLLYQEIYIYIYISLSPYMLLVCMQYGCGLHYVHAQNPSLKSWLRPWMHMFCHTTGNRRMNSQLLPVPYIAHALCSVLTHLSGIF